MKHARDEATVAPVSAVVFVGDAFEERLDMTADTVEGLGRLRAPCFMFQERQDANAKLAFREIARMTGGAYCEFDEWSAKQLGALLRAIAIFALGGREALANRTDEASVKLLRQMK